MAFQKTKGRGVFVQPTGMPNLSGFSQAAAEYSNIAKLGMSIGTNERQKEFNDAIREAEIQGKTSGVKRDADGNLEPLVNFEYAKAAEMYSDKEKDAVLKAYKTAAIGAYTSQAVSGIYSAANESYLANSNDPDAIEASMQGYMSSLSKMDQDIYLKLAPKAEAAFLEVKNRAAAKQQQEAEETSRVFFGEHFDQNMRQLGNLVAVGSSGEPNDDAAFADRFSELQEEQEQILENLATFGATPTQIQELRELQGNHLAIRAGQSHIDRVFTATQSYEKTLTAISKIVAEAPDDVNVDVLRQSLDAHAADLVNIQNQRKKEEGENRENIYQAISREIYLREVGSEGKKSVAEMLANPQHPIHQLEGTQIGSLLSIDDADRKEYANNIYNEEFAFLQNWKTIKGTEFEQNLLSRFFSIRDLYEKGLVDFGKYEAARVAYLEYEDDKFVKPERDTLTGYVSKELSKASSYLRPPEFWAAKKPDLIAAGVIGPKSLKYKNEQSYNDALFKYAVEYRKQENERIEGSAALRKAQAGLKLGKTELDALNKFTPNYKAIMPDNSVRPVDFFPVLENGEEDIEHFLASVDAVDRYANETGGQLHPSAKEIVDNLVNTPQLADKAKRIVGQIVTGISATESITQEEALYDLIAINDLDNKTTSALMMATKLSPELAVDAIKALDSVDTNRGLNAILPTRADGVSLDQATDELFDTTFREAMTGHNWWKLLNPKISSMRQQQLIEFAESADINLNDLGQAVILDPDVRSAVKGIFLERVAHVKGQGDAKEIMRQALIKVGKRFGYEENKATGEIYLVERPIMDFGQATIPSMRIGGRNQPMFTLTREMIDADFTEKWFSRGTPGLRNSRLDEAMRSVTDYGNLYRSDLTFHANINFGSQQTYTVILTDHYGNPTVVDTDYKWEFASSIQAPHYEQVMNRMKTERGKEFWSMMGLFDRSLLQNNMEQYSRRASDRSLMGIVRKLDELRILTHEGAPQSFIDGMGQPFNKEEIEDVMEAYQSWVSLGYY